MLSPYDVVSLPHPQVQAGADGMLPPELNTPTILLELRMRR